MRHVWVVEAMIDGVWWCWATRYSRKDARREARKQKGDPLLEKLRIVKYTPEGRKK